MIGIIGVTISDIVQIASELSSTATEKVCGIEFQSGYIGGVPVVAAASGTGIHAASVASALMAGKFGVSAIISIGSADALSPQAHAGDVIVASAVATAGARAEASDPVLPDAPGPVSSDITVSGILFEAASADRWSGYTWRGTIASGDSLASDRCSRMKLCEELSAISFDSSASAIGAVCSASGIPFAILRCVVSDFEGDAGDRLELARTAAQTESRILLGALPAIAELGF